MLFAFVIGIDDKVEVCTPYSPVKVVNEKLDDALGVLASTNELTTNKYWIAPVASDSAPDSVIVNVDPETEHVLVKVTVEYVMAQVTVVPENLI